MLRKTKKGYYILDKLDKSGLIHAFSARKHQNMSLEKSFKVKKNQENFLKMLGLKKQNLVLAEQVHQDRVLWVKSSKGGRILNKTDGLLTAKRGIILGVRTADCLPILVFDPAKKIIGAVHAGWKGVLLEIGAKAIKLMKKMGSSPERILVGIGPHIGVCCYDIPLERKKAFEKKFGLLPGMIERKNNQFFLNLAVPMTNQLRKEGINPKNIEVAKACTSCCQDEFFSFRREKGKNGLMLSLVSLIN